MTRPGIGLYGGLPSWTTARVMLDVPVIQVREVQAQAISVGYGCLGLQPRPSQVAHHRCPSRWADRVLGQRGDPDNEGRRLPGHRACPSMDGLRST